MKTFAYIPQVQSSFFIEFYKHIVAKIFQTTFQIDFLE